MGTTIRNVAVLSVKIPNYQFDANSNPFAFDVKEPASVGMIANELEKALEGNFDAEHILVRGVQSKHHGMSRDELVGAIVKNGSDTYSDGLNEKGTVYAAPYVSGCVKKLLEGFHVFKPKCEERPQYPVDIWLIFDADVYDNVEYVHPRHKVVTRDKWKLKPGEFGLRGVLVVN